MRERPSSLMGWSCPRQYTFIIRKQTLRPGASSRDCLVSNGHVLWGCLSTSRWCHLGEM